MVVYGFHPDEPLAEEIGTNMKEELRLDGVDFIKFRPVSMVNNLHQLPEREAEYVETKGLMELKRYVKENYSGKELIINLHETPISIDDWSRSHPQFGLYFPGWNRRLRRILEQFAEWYPKKVWVVGHRPDIYPTYHSLTLEYYSRLIRGYSILTLNKTEGEKFAKDLITYLIKNYVRRS